MEGKKRDVKSRLGWLKYEKPILHQVDGDREAGQKHQRSHNNLKCRRYCPSAAHSSNTQIQIYCKVNIIIHSKLIRAKLDSGVQCTRIGTDVAQLVLKNSENRVIKRLVKTNAGLKMKKFLKCRMGTKLARMRDIECIIDPTVATKEVVLGMVALKSLSYRFQVGGKDTYQTITKTPKGSQEKRKWSRKTNEEMFPFLDESEAANEEVYGSGPEMDDGDVIYDLDDQDRSIIHW